MPLVGIDATGDPAPPSSRSPAPDGAQVRGRRIDVWLGAALFAVAIVVSLATNAIGFVNRTFALDLDINLAGAHRLLAGRSPYDTLATRAAAVRTIGPAMRHTFTSPFNSFIGMPIVGLIHAPLLFMSNDDAVDVFRALMVLASVAGVVVCAKALPRQNQLGGALLGLGALVLSFPFLVGIGVGQPNGLVLLFLAIGIWGTASGRDPLAGAGLGAATVLKISPVVLVVYLLMRGRRRAATWAAITGAVLCAATGIAGQPTAIAVWIEQVLPRISLAPTVPWNQSVPAWITRLASGASDGRIDFARPLGPCIAIAATVALAWWCRGRPRVEPQELGLLVLVILLAGPLSWIHYFMWAVLPITLLVDARLWTGVRTRTAVTLGALSAVAILMFRSQPRFEPTGAISNNLYPIAAMLIAIVTLVLLHCERTKGTGGDTRIARSRSRPGDPGVGEPASPVRQGSRDMATETSPNRDSELASLDVTRKDPTGHGAGTWERVRH